MKSFTDIEQSKKLIELGINVNTADMYYPNRIGMDNYPLPIEWKNGLPLLSQEILAWSLSALIELMPERIKIGEELSFCLASKKSSTGFSFGYNLNASTFVADNPLDAAFEMVVWLLKNALI